MMHIRDVMNILRTIPGKKEVYWKTLKHNGMFHMDQEFVLNMSVTRLAKTWNLGHHETSLHLKVHQMSEKPIEDVGFVTKVIHTYDVTHGNIICVSQQVHADS
jgi:hypothetical protein